MTETIISAAHRVPFPQSMREEMWLGKRVYPDYMIVFTERPGRHHTAMHGLYAIGVDIKDPNNQGFLTSTGRWVDRKEGCLIAQAANQIKVKTGPDDILFSEDMW